MLESPTESSRPTTRGPILENFYVRWAAVFGAWLLIASFFAAVGSQSTQEKGQAMDPEEIFLFMMIYWLSWAIVSPAILRFARVFHWDRGHRWRSIAAHAAFAAVIAPLQCYLYLGLRSLIGPSLGYVATPSSEGWTFALQCLTNVPVYFIIVAVYNAFAYYHMYHQQKSATSELQARLAEAELAALKMQLQPHFLFNTLNAISVLMNEDVDKANQMLVRLSELLRLALDSSGRQQVPLKQELEFLERYLGIERIRFADRLRVRMDVEPAALDAHVPNLILQPLVENAIRHSIAPRAEGGQLDVRARRNNGKLELEIHDDGQGISDQAEPSDRQNGIGLANCQSRLAQLYGDQHTFRMGPSRDGGFSVVLTLPFETVPSPDDARV